MSKKKPTLEVILSENDKLIVEVSDPEEYISVTLIKQNIHRCSLCDSVKDTSEILNDFSLVDFLEEILKKYAPHISLKIK